MFSSFILHVTMCKHIFKMFYAKNLAKHLSRTAHGWKINSGYK